MDKINRKISKLLEDYGFCYRIKDFLNSDGFEKYDSFFNEEEKNFGVNLDNGKKVIFQWDDNGKYDFIDEQGKPIIWKGTGKSYIFENNAVILRDHLFTIAESVGKIKLKDTEINETDTFLSTERKEQQHRLQNKEKSNATKLAWKRNHGNYMRGTRERERKEMNRSFYDVCTDLKEHITEAEITKDNVFELKLDISLDSIAGGISLTVNKTNGNVSISTSLEQTGAGQYRLTDFDDAALKTLFNNLKDDLFNICKNFDEEINQVIASRGLKSTK